MDNQENSPTSPNDKVENIQLAQFTMRSRFLTAQEVCSLLRCSRSTVARMIKKGTLPKPFHRNGCSNSPLLFPVAELARYGFIGDNVDISNVKVANMDLIKTSDGKVLVDLPSQCKSTSRINF